jgi:hypothetical protein
VFVALAPPTRRSPVLREQLLKETAIRAAALGDDPRRRGRERAELGGVRLATVRGSIEVLLVECTPPELDFFARELEAQLPVRVEKVLLRNLATP